MGEIVKQQDNRRVFVDTLLEIAEHDRDVILVCCDVGFNYLDEFKEKFPDRFFNFGVTEASSMIICSAMALTGKKVYFYSMINFSLFRPAEMVRNGVVHHSANVKIIGVKGSESYRFLGFSHNIIHPREDLNFCENIGLDYYIPQSLEEVKKVVQETYQNSKPAYIRL